MSREQPDLRVPEPPPHDRVDLHSHSYYSDGEHSPRDVAAMATRAGVAALALTDHDCLDGLAEFVEHASGFEPVCGVEISARYRGADVHVLGLMVSPGDDRLRDRLAELGGHREERTRRMVERIRRAGVDLTEEAVRKQSETGTLGRPHVAKALVAAGAAGSVDAAFRRWLRPGRPGFVEKPGPSPAEAVSWIHEAGGAAVLAHPGLLRDRKWIASFVSAGMDGIEVWHPRHTPATRARLLKLAGTHGLVPCGGSDYHGAGIGTAVIGQEPVPRDTLERLRARVSA